MTKAQRIAFTLTTIALTISCVLAVKDPSFRDDFAKLAPSAFTALATLAKEDKQNLKRK